MQEWFIYGAAVRAEPTMSSLLLQVMVAEPRALPALLLCGAQCEVRNKSQGDQSRAGGRSPSCFNFPDTSQGWLLNPTLNLWATELQPHNRGPRLGADSTAKH